MKRKIERKSVHKPDRKYRKRAEENCKFNPNIRSFQPKSKIDPFECFTFEEDINHETVFTKIQPQGYYTLIDNLQKVGNLIYSYKL